MHLICSNMKYQKNKREREINLQTIAQISYGCVYVRVCHQSTGVYVFKSIIAATRQQLKTY